MFLAESALLEIAVFLIILYIGNILREFLRYKQLMYSLPGPRRHPIFGNFLQIIDGDNIFTYIRQYSQEFKTVYILTVTIFFDCINIAGPDEYQLIASSSKNNKKGYAYNFLHRWLGEGLLTSTDEKWQLRRKLLTPAFHFTILQKFVHIFNKETDKLVELLKHRSDETCVNIVPIISQFTLNTIANTSMGTSIDITNESDKRYVAATFKMGKIVYYRYMRPWCINNFIFYNFIPLGYLERKLLKELHGFTNKIIKDRSAILANSDEDNNSSKYEKMALLDLLLNMKEKDGLIDEAGIAEEVNTFMFEGHDTTSISISFTLMLLACHEDVQEAVYQEIIQVLGTNNKHPTIDDLNELKYTERVLKESLRLYPSVPFISRALEEDVTTKEGFILPAGAQVNIHIFDIHRNKLHWPNPEKFDPDRFLPENCKNRHPFAFVPFSAGPRNCIGQKYAMLELKSVLSGILRNFKLEPVDTPETIKLVPDMMLRTEEECIKVKFIPRMIFPNFHSISK